MNLEALLTELAVARRPLQQLRERAAVTPRRILFPEARDERVLAAAAALADCGLARPLLLGKPPWPGSAGDVIGCLGPECWLDPEDPARREEVVGHLRRRRRHRGLTQGQAHVLAAEPLFQAASLLAMGAADALVAGAAESTAEVARASLWCIGPAADVRTVSGAFLMLPPDREGSPLLMADCAVVPVPTEEQLVEIARTSVASFERLLQRPPAVAFLSFSTAGSSTHESARVPARAAARFAAERADLAVVGEIQVDAALVPEVARAKGIDWGGSRTADLLVFPDLGSGNIGHKLVQRLGGWRAIGPLLQGLRRPVCDLSRGCSAADVVDATSLVTLLCQPER